MPMCLTCYLYLFPLIQFNSILPITAPATPNITVIDSCATNATLQIAPGDGDVDYFSGSYEVIDDNTCEHSGTFEVDANGGTVEYVLTGLRPGLTYQVEVGAVVEAVG